MADWSQQLLAHSHCWLNTSTNFQRQRRSFGMSQQRYTLHGLGGGGATSQRLQYRALPQSRRRGRWTSARTLERCVPDASPHHQSQLSREVRRPLSVLSQSSRLVSLQKTTESPATSPVQPPRCNGKGTGVHCVLRSGVGQRSFVHTVSSLGALPFLGTWDENKEQADDAHDTTPDTLGWTVSSNAYGGRALELHTIDFAGASFSRRHLAVGLRSCWTQQVCIHGVRALPGHGVRRSKAEWNFVACLSRSQCIDFPASTFDQCFDRLFL